MLFSTNKDELQLARIKESSWSVKYFYKKAYLFVCQMLLTPHNFSWKFYWSNFTDLFGLFNCIYIYMLFYKFVREWILTQWVSVGTGFWEANKMGKTWAYSACQAGEVKVRLSRQGGTAAHESRQSQLRDMILYLWYQWQDTVSIAFTLSRPASRTLRIHLHLSFASTRVDVMFRAEMDHHLESSPL